MQDNIITLPVDVANNGTIVEQAFRRYSAEQNRALYISPTHTTSKRDTMTLIRTLPKPNGKFLGVNKSDLKFTKDTDVPTQNPEVLITAPAIMECSSSIPVGTPSATVKELRQRVIAFLDAEVLAATLQELLEV